jgi:SAM-dependent MidA family methyltransferase
MAEAGIDAGLQLLGYTNQAAFLIDCGLTDLLAGQDTAGAGYVKQVAGAQKLLSPAEMGELFKVLALGKAIRPPLPGFRQIDLRRLL